MIKKCERERCLSTFEEGKKGRRFCSDQCATASRVAKHRERNRRSKSDSVFVNPGSVVIVHWDVCEECGDEFLSAPTTSVGGAARKFCGDKCRRDARKLSRSMMD